VCFWFDAGILSVILRHVGLELCWMHIKYVSRIVVWLAVFRNPNSSNYVIDELNTMCFNNAIC
jgi:hypothetical protein